MNFARFLGGMSEILSSAVQTTRSTGLSAAEAVSENAVLDRLSRATLSELLPHLRPVVLGLRDTQKWTDLVVFPLTCVLAVSTAVITGESVDTLTIGREGVIPAPGKTGEVVVRHPGVAMVIRASLLQEVAGRREDLRQVLERQAQDHLSEVQQTAICALAHRLDQRLANSLLRLSEKAGTPLVSASQSEMGGMLGVQRTSINAAAKRFKSARAVSYSRGRIRILNADCLDEIACGCGR